MNISNCSKSITLYITMSDDTEYRTNETGTSWERLYGNSWEMVHSEEEANCIKAFETYLFFKTTIG